MRQSFRRLAEEPIKQKSSGVFGSIYLTGIVLGFSFSIYNDGKYELENCRKRQKNLNLDKNDNRELLKKMEYDAVESGIMQGFNMALIRGVIWPLTVFQQTILFMNRRKD